MQTGEGAQSDGGGKTGDSRGEQENSLPEGEMIDTLQ